MVRNPLAAKITPGPVSERIGRNLVILIKKNKVLPSSAIIQFPILVRLVADALYRLIKKFDRRIMYEHHHA